ncbi:MAG: hypothetical protein DRJ38_04135 [Thermoprotei archaeon]|nr:MAG: hypothetical protein DRJ38_04135 [Thermoprotei archaeon]
MVVLEKLEVRNFRKLNLSITFPKGMLIIKGPNEAGKSTVLEAILYALFGKTLRGTKDLAVNHRADSARVKLIFSVDGRRYQVERIIRKKRESEARIFEITPSGGLTKKAATVKSTNDIIRSLLGGLSLNEILVTNVVAQKELDKLIEMKGQEREKIINALLGLESYNKAIEKLSQERREKKKELEHKKQVLVEVKKRLEDYKRAIEEFKEKSLELQEKEKMYKESMRKFQEKESFYRILKEYRDSLMKKEKIKAEIKGIKDLLKAKKESLSKLKSQIISKKKEKRELETVLEKEENRIKDLKKTLAEYEGLDIVKVKVEDFRNKLVLLKNLKEKINEIKTRKEELEKGIRELEAKFDKERYEKLREESEELASKISKTRISTPLLIALLSTSLTGFLNPIFYITGFLLAGLYYLAVFIIKYRMLSRYRVVKDEIASYSGVFSLLNERRNNLKRIQSDFQEFIIKARKVEAEIKEIEKSIPERYKPESWENLSDLLEKIIEKIKEDEKGKITIENNVMALERRCEDLKKRIAKIDAEINELNALCIKIVEDIGRIEEELLRLEKELKAIILPSLPNGVTYSEELYRDVEMEYDLLKTQVAALKATIHQLEIYLEHLKKRIKENENIEEEYEKLSREVEELEKLVNAQEIAIHSLKQVAKSLREEFLPAIMRNMNYIISAITGGKYKAVRLDSKYNIEVLDSEAGRFIPKDIYSGGMVDQLLLAMRLAFILSLLPETKHTYPRFLFLDEPLSSSDRERRKNIIDLLTKTLKDQFNQIILITHVDIDVEDAKVVSIEEGRIKSYS